MTVHSVWVCVECGTEHGPEDTKCPSCGARGRITRGILQRYGLDHEPTARPDPTISSALDIHAELPITPAEKEWVCADCGAEYAEGYTCDACGGHRIVLKSVVAELFGPDWRKAFD